MGIGHPPPPAPRWLDVTYRWRTPPLIGVSVLNFLGVFGGFHLPLGFIVFGVPPSSISCDRPTHLGPSKTGRQPARDPSRLLVARNVRCGPNLSLPKEKLAMPTTPGANDASEPAATDTSPPLRH